MGRFDAAYEGTPPWDIGRPQPAFVELTARGHVRSPVLDVGCGTGENALYLASQGFEVVGVDLVPKAIEKARAKAHARSLPADFEVADALALESLGRTFRTIVDSAVFHVFEDDDRSRYVESIRRVLEPGGKLLMLVFSDREPTEWGGPRRIRRDEIEAAFADGFRVDSIAETRLETTFHTDGGGHAWIARIVREG